MRMKRSIAPDTARTGLRTAWLGCLCLFACGASAHPRTPEPEGPRHIVIAFYNTENLFDTIPASPDDPYAPGGSRRWDSQRYRQKISNIARALDSLKADIVGLAEIENESVLRDLVAALRTSYNYAFRPGNDPRGMNVALLYRGSLFHPLRTFQLRGPGLSRPVLAVRGRLAEDTLTLMVAHMPSLLNRSAWRKAAARTLRNRLDEVMAEDPSGKIILMGDLNMGPGSGLARKSLGIAPWPDPPPGNHQPDNVRPPLFTPFFSLERRGEGSYVYRDHRYLYDYMLLNDAWTRNRGWTFRGRCGIFSPGFLWHETGPKRGYPKRTFDREGYTGGFSDHLPVWLILEK